MIFMNSYASTRMFSKEALNSRLLVLGASFLIAIFAHVSIPLPFTPVPIATQSSVCLFLGALLGSRKGTLAVLAFLLQGAVGLPVFAGGAAGFAHFFGPTGGYLIGYLVATYIAGLIVERSRTKDFKTVLWSLVLGTGFVSLFGVLWLSTFIGLKSAFMLGFVPFILGDFIKIGLSLKALQMLGVGRKNIA